MRPVSPTWRGGACARRSSVYGKNQRYESAETLASVTELHPQGGFMDEPDIWRDAHMMIERHANIAELAAAMEVDRFIERGDPAGEARAKRVLSAIKALRRGARVHPHLLS
jgi:hypothetical protein